MKAVISNRIQLQGTPELFAELEKELTYTLPSRMPSDPPIIFKTIRPLTTSIVSIPVGRMDLIPDGYEIVDKRVIAPMRFPEFKFELRATQKAVCDAIDDNAIVNAWVSWGKTFTGLAIAGQLGQKTLVVTHTTNLRNQWIKEVKKVYGIDAGIIGSGKFDIAPCVCVGNIQSLYRRVNDLKKHFGTIILDEMHHVSSPTFTRIIDEMPARYKIGLTGTLERKDGRHVVFRDYFGSNIHRPPKENYLIPKIHVIRSEIRFPDGSYIPWAERINELAYNEEYIHSISLIAAKYAAEGHKVLVVSDRVQFLKVCARLVGENSVSITGDLDFSEREVAINKILNGEKDILFGTQAIFSEGISVDNLSCLILGTPVNNEPLLTQLIGRVIRKQDGKPQPIIIDIHLKGKTASRQASARMGYYMKQGYEVKVL